ncbi:GpE family phage tail protein [Pseudomonas sp. 10B1]|nr:GpE family phage tail protein [Pseudomonas sp. 10B1]
MTKFYGWGPRDARSLTLSELLQWNEQAIKMKE